MNIYLLQQCFKKPLLLFILVATLTFLAIFISQISSESGNIVHLAGLTRRNTSNYDLHPKSLARDHLDGRENEIREQIDSLTSRVEDLKRIKLSIKNELRLMERERAKIARDRDLLMNRNEKLIVQINKSKMQLKQFDLDLSASSRQRHEQTCDIYSRVSPIVFNPMKAAYLENYTLPTPSHHAHVNDEQSLPFQILEQFNQYAFDLSLCPLTRDFTFQTPAESTDLTESQVDNIRDRVSLEVINELLQSHNQFRDQSSNTCVTIMVIDKQNELTFNSGNNLVINLMDSEMRNKNNQNLSGQAVIASPEFPRRSFRHGIDIVLPSIWQMPDNYDTIVGSIPPQSSLERKYFASYFGSYSGQALTQLERALQVIHRNSIDDLFLFLYNCDQATNAQCYDDRGKMIELSIFLIILPNENYDIDENTNDLLYLALSRGAIPVIFGKEWVRLPFDEVIDWRRASILLPTARLPEVHFILRSIGAADLYQMKYHGRRIFESYFATSKQILETLISLVRLERFNHPPPPIPGLATQLHYRPEELTLDTNCSSSACLEAKSDTMSGLIASEIHGPREKPFASWTYRRNFSLALSATYDLWNHPARSAKYLYPNHPTDPVPPSEYKFLTPDQGFRPIGDGLGGSGSEFSRSLGGDYPNEQFTIVILTYERKLLLMKTLERLKGLAYLNKILVIWNSVSQRPDNLVWPDVGVPIVVVKTRRNSLNNRFLPYDLIETEAIFSMDDDSPLRQDEIVFAFRVWRQSRERIVGFPGRFHAWDGTQSTWMYNSNHSCELSMVLTGGAFFHKFYSYLYTYSMPESIRLVVDRFMNCEDIAMNFLVAHLTRQPPIKVTSRWTFHCATCASSLSEDDSHFRERHECLNIFTSIYGYMPLLNTQHRSDSILFKTRVPRDKQKCFKFV